MGLIKAIAGAAGGVLADQWKEFFYCESMSADVLCVKGKKKVTKRSSNTKGDENIISNGSVVSVADGQCMLIVEQGKVVEVCAEPGEFTWNSSTEPSIFAGSFGQALIDSFKNIGKRFTFGGEAPKDQRVYYINTKEIIGNKYGTPNTIPFRVVDLRAAIDIDISVRCFGEYSYRIVDPVVFYTNLCGNVTEDFVRDAIDSQLKSEFLTSLQPAFAGISELGIRYSAVPAHTTELADLLKKELSSKWKVGRGIEIGTVGVSSISAIEEDERMLKDLQKNTAFMDTTRAAANLVGAQADSMKIAAGNQSGAAAAFMGMGMAGSAGGMNAQALYQMEGQLSSNAQASKGGDSWKCSCGVVATGKFCPECGKAKPVNDVTWTCKCGAKNKGKFCSECGEKMPSGAIQYKCDKCGWEPLKGEKPPKFCPECGDPFDDGDIVK